MESMAFLILNIYRLVKKKIKLLIMKINKNNYKIHQIKIFKNVLKKTNGINLLLEKSNKRTNRISSKARIKMINNPTL